MKRRKIEKLGQEQNEKYFVDKLIYQKSEMDAPVKGNNLSLLNTSQFKGKSNASMQLSYLKSNYYFVSKPFVAE